MKGLSHLNLEKNLAWAIMIGDVLTIYEIEQLT